MIEKILLVIIAITLSVAAFASETSQICVSRQEDGGVLNIRPAEITANGKSILWIVGGEKKCVEVTDGRYSIVAQSADPYDPNDKRPNTWKSKPLLVTVEIGKKANIAVFPISKDVGYAGPWELKKQ